MNPQAQQLPHDINGLVPYTPPIWGYLVAGLAGLVLLLALIYLWRRFRKGQGSADTLTPPVDPLKECLKSLKRLEPQHPFNRKNQVSFFYELSHLFKAYIEYSGHFRATDLTTAELKVQIEGHSGALSLDPEELMAFFREADLIKFAEKEAKLTYAEDSYAKVMGWVDRLEAKRISLEVVPTSQLGKEAAGEV